MIKTCWADGSAAQVSWSAEERLWWLLWSAVPGLGCARLYRLWSRFGSLAAAWAAPAQVLAQVKGIGPARLAAIEQCRRRAGAAPLAAVRASGVLLPGDAALPAALKVLARPPLHVYWRGRGQLWSALRQGRAVAVVGTRRPSAHGLAMAAAIGEALARAGWPVVSGLAEGIDAAAHQGCLRAGGRPVGVLGTSLDRVYPSHHSQLQQQVAARGLLLSEQAPGAAVCAGHFAARNRLQVAISCAVVLVECPEPSGALHAARLAWQGGRKLWVVPADAAKHSAAGSNRWLQQGAAPLLKPADLVAALGPGPLAPQAAAAPVRRLSPRSAAPLDQSLLNAVGSGASLEQLSGQLGQSGIALMPRLLALELAGLVQAEPGLRWRAAN
ncbi:MAG: DNA-processing protein DprA [Cyanobacteria bacterium K_DeepCast_35m_m2_155]|nr:DNA-processing protein DprA [Cyanobacteria bacterium K_DeepCast_35m_m2_155]